MEDDDFVADSDEEEQSATEELALIEERSARERLERDALSRKEDAQKDEKVVVVTPEKEPEVEEQFKEQEGHNEVQQEDGVLDVGTLVEVDSRTWPGINKLGGSARVARVYRETGEDGQSEDVFYDVRYVLGGFEKHLESEYVHSSELLNQQSNRERVDREYYADKFIDEPHKKKQAEAEKKRMLAAQAGQNGAAPYTRTKKRSHREARSEPVADEVGENTPEDDGRGRTKACKLDEVGEKAPEDDGRGRAKARKLDEDTFIFSESTSSSLEVSRRSASGEKRSTKTVHEIQSPPVKKPSGQRRRYRISDSSDEDSSDGEDMDVIEDVGPERRAREDHADILPKRALDYDRGSEAQTDTRSTDHHRSRRKTHDSTRRHFVGGYEHNGEDADGLFIQPEGDPGDLPEDVLRGIGITLATTKKGLMVQLLGIFGQQQKYMADFRKEQVLINQKLMKLEQIPLTDLQKLPGKVNELERFVTKTLINAGEDVMNSIIKSIKQKRGKTPAALEGFEFSFDNWQDDLKDCSKWLRNAKMAVDYAFEKRHEVIPQVEETEAGYASDSGTSSHSTDTYVDSAVSNDTVDPSSNQVDFSYDYVPPVPTITTRNSKSQFRRVTKPELRLTKTFKTTTHNHRKAFMTSTTLDDFFPRGVSKSFRPNLRLIGRQRNITKASDPRWNWVKMARKKQRRVGTSMRSAKGSSISNGVGRNLHEPRPKSGRSQDVSMTVQSQRIYLRDKRFRGQSTQDRSRESFSVSLAPPHMRSAVFPTGIHFDDGSPDKRSRPAEPVMSTMPRGSSKQQQVNWETVFEAVSDDPCLSAIGENHKAISRQRQESLLAFGLPISGPLVPHLLLSGNHCEFEDGELFRDVVVRRTARLRQLLNDLRLREKDFMDSFSRGGLGTINEDEYMSTPEWISLISLEEALHTAIASLAAQLLEALDTIPTPSLICHLQTVFEEVATLIRQLPDCEVLFGGSKAYFFFFEMASRDAATTPLLTAISRTYWYCLSLLVAVRSKCARLLTLNAKTKQMAEKVFLDILPVTRVILGIVLFLFDLHLYLPSSHRLDDSESDTPSNEPLPALSLWLLVRDCFTKEAGLDQGPENSLVTRETQFWTLIQLVYREGSFDELARCFVRSESFGGYVGTLTPKATNQNDMDEVMESQLLALEATWDLLTVLSRVYLPEKNRDHESTIFNARWAVVKVLLHPDNQNFLPFKSPDLQPDYKQRADTYKLHVLKRITGFSRQWHPCKEIIKIIVQQLWEHETSNQPNDILELPQLLKQFVTQCKELGNSTSQLTAFAEASISDELDSTTELCRIIWIQYLKLEKRVHRLRFRRFVLSLIPIVDVIEASTLQTSGQGATTSTVGNWIWDPKQRTKVSEPPVTPSPRTVLQQSPTTANAGKDRISISVLLSFSVLEICKECGDEDQLHTTRAGKDFTSMEGDINFYCNEILRWTAGKPACEVLAAQALFAIGALLLEKCATGFSVVFRSLNQKLASAVANIEANPIVTSTQKDFPATGNVSRTHDMEKRRRRFLGANMAALYQMRDLVRKMVETPKLGFIIGPGFGPAVEKSLEYIFSGGVEACLSGATRKLIADRDLKIVMEIFELVLPRATDEPSQCAPSDFREFEDMDNLLISMDWDENGLAHNSPAPAWTVNNCQSKAIQLITANLRVVLQQLVLKYPQTERPAFDELYAIDLLGMTISTCEVQFLWSNMRTTSARARHLAPRVLSAALKYNPEKEWLGNVFLRESGSDHELATAWLLSTLDMSTLNSTPISFKVEDVPFSVVNSSLAEASSAAEEKKDGVRDSDSWVMLTDGIIYHLLREKPVGLLSMDPQILQLLRGVASTCKFPTAVRGNKKNLQDVAVLYDLHLNVFQTFCQSAGTIWSSYIEAPAKHRKEMNQFRPKTTNSHSGIFVAFVEAYKLNFRKACDEIDEVNHDWHLFAKLFLRHAGVNATGGRSYHQMDDTIKPFDERLTGLTTMFRFMYQCMDALFFHCGEMAIGDNTIFFDAMELLFRQVNSAEYPQAIKRLQGAQTLDQRRGVRDLNAQLRKGFCTQAMTFVDSVQLFFARQKYPSLLHWFAQTSEIYLTFGDGWDNSPLRTLLVNVLDPDGPLGIYMYYPGEETSTDFTLNVDVKSVRREAFYLSCGLFNCKCTSSFEHSRAKSSSQSCERIQHLRKFILDKFMCETFEFGQKHGTTCLLETMVPICQLVRAVLNHANLNANKPIVTEAEESRLDYSSSHCRSSQDFQLIELHPCLEWMVECMIKLIPAETAVKSSISCVLLIELCGIMCEAIAFNEHRPMLELIDLIEVMLSYLRGVYVSLAKRTTAVMDPLFAACVEVSPSTRLNAYHFISSNFRAIVVEQDSIPDKQVLTESYGINIARATTDLVTAIIRVAQQCKMSSDERLRSFTSVSP